jgi:hypothetical protein
MAKQISARKSCVGRIARLDHSGIENFSQKALAIALKAVRAAGKSFPKLLELFFDDRETCAYGSCVKPWSALVNQSQTGGMVRDTGFEPVTPTVSR